MRKLNKRPAKPVLNMIISLISGFISAFIIIMLIAFIMTKKDINSEYIKYFWIAVILIQGIVTGFACGRKFRYKTFIAGGIAGAAAGLADLITIILINGFNISSFTFCLIPAIIISSMIFSVISSNL